MNLARLNVACAVVAVAATVLAWFVSSHYIDRYDSLLLWACEHGNGGYECGEE